jgi:hypothetical protein
MPRSHQKLVRSIASHKVHHNLCHNRPLSMGDRWRHMAAARAGKSDSVDRWVDVRRRSLTEPTAEIADDEDRRRAAMLANVALGLALILTLAAVVSVCTSALLPDPDQSLGLGGTLVVGATAIVFWVCLYLARRAHFEVGAWLMILTIDVFLIFIGLLCGQMRRA